MRRYIIHKSGEWGPFGEGPYMGIECSRCSYRTGSGLGIFGRAWRDIKFFFHKCYAMDVIEPSKPIGKIISMEEDSNGITVYAKINDKKAFDKLFPQNKDGSF